MEHTLDQPFGWEQSEWEQRYCYSHLTLNYDGNQLANVRRIIGFAKSYNDYCDNNPDHANKFAKMVRDISLENQQLANKQEMKNV
jgi:hypothetical protein